jgi:hypothetical protein
MANKIKVASLQTALYTFLKYTGPAKLSGMHRGFVLPRNPLVMVTSTAERYTVPPPIAENLAPSIAIGPIDIKRSLESRHFGSSEDST